MHGSEDMAGIKRSGKFALGKKGKALKNQGLINFFGRSSGK